jgi:hypothetical protein
MKYINLIPAYLLALIFIVFGANFFLHFLTMPPMAGDAGTFAGILYTTGFLTIVKVLEITVGAILLFNKTRPLALLLIAPIVVNIFLFEILIAHKPGIGVLILIINAIAIYQNKKYYLPIIGVGKTV